MFDLLPLLRPRTSRTAMVLLATLCTLPAFASSAIALTLDDLGLAAQRVIRGKVLSTTSHWAPDGRRILTHVHIQVQEALKGPSEHLTVVQPGGVVGDIAQVTQGLARLEKDQEVVLFLERSSGGWRPVGLSQGVFHVEKDPSSGRQLARPSVNASLQLFDRRTLQVVIPDRTPIPLEALRQHVRQEGAAGGGAR